MFQNIINFIQNHSLLLLIILLSINLLYLICKAIKTIVKKDFLKKKYQKLLLFLEIKKEIFFRDFTFLYNHNLIISIWYFVIFTSVLILCILSWQEINELSFTPPTKNTILFILLIILMLIPFGNMEIFGIKVNSNNPLNNNDSKSIPEKISDEKEKTIAKLKQRLDEINKNMEGKENAK